MERSEAAAEARELLGIVFEHAATHGGLWMWLKDTDERLYRTLAALQNNRSNAPNSTTLIMALDAAGYRLVAVPSSEFRVRSSELGAPPIRDGAGERNSWFEVRISEMGDEGNGRRKAGGGK